MPNISQLQNPLSSHFRMTGSQGLGSSMLPEQQVWQSKDPNAAGTALLTTYAGGTQPGDALEAMRSDAQRFEGKVAEMETARRQGLDALGRTLSGEAGGEQRERAAQSAADLKSGLAERTGRAREGLAGAQEAAEALGPAAEQRRQETLQASEQRRTEALQEAEQMKQEALQEYSDDTAIAVQSQRATLQSNLKTQRQRILDEAGQRGLGPDSPEVQQQLQQVEMNGLGQLGILAGQASLQFNDTQSKLRMTYDEMGTRVRGLQDQLATTARSGADKYTGLSQAQGAELRTKVASLNESLEMAAQQEHRAIEQMRSQNALAADQLELAGASTMASYVRNWEYAMAPMAPIVSLAAKLTADLKLQANLSATSVASGITPEVGAMDILRSGGGSPGTSSAAPSGAGGTSGGPTWYSPTASEIRSWPEYG